MISYEGVDRNFQLLVLEVRKQLESVHRLLKAPAEGLVRGVLSRDNYTDSLKALIEKKCISYFRHTPTIDKSSANLVTAVNVAATNLERMADFCVNIAERVHQLHDPACLRQVRFEGYFTELLEVVPLVDAAFKSVDTAVALRVCRAESRLDRLYGADFRTLRDALQAGGDTDDLLACLYIVHYLERMGDSLLNIGEAALFAATGEKLKLHEYLRLRDALAARHPDAAMQDYSVEFNWETRSGCRIAKVVDRSEGGEEPEAIFKKGQAEKVRSERMNIARWEKVRPGLPPKVLEFRENEQDAALLLEFIDGLTVRDLVLNGDPQTTEEALNALERTFQSVWSATRKDEPVQARFLDQARDRLDDVFRLHPQLQNAHFEVGPLAFASLEELLEECKQAERTLAAPFSTLIHGDLNTDNIIYNMKEKTVHLIDLHRSCDSDYVQDVSVFLVSNFRVPIFDRGVREALNRVILRTYRFAEAFARVNDDETFAARMALGLARSFITSTRFEFDADFAKLMFIRAVYLLEKVLRHSARPWQELRLASEVLVY